MGRALGQAPSPPPFPRARPRGTLAVVERVTGIGGFFFAAADPDAVGRWYSEHLGVDVPPQTYGTTSWEQEAGATVVAAMPPGADALGGPGRSWAINFRVGDLDAMVAQLRGAGIEVVVDPESYPNGRFADLRDPEGNAVQLWQAEGADRP